jgi:hypothetical protein
MICGRARSASDKFMEWASLFQKGPFVMLAVYADESGTNKDSIAPVVGGYIGMPVEWETFCRDWKGVLDYYRVDYFHFREWVDALEAIRRTRDCKIKNNPFQGMNEDSLTELLFDLAEIAGRQVPVGGMINLVKCRTVHKGYQFEPLFEWFIYSLKKTIKEHWPGGLAALKCFSIRQVTRNGSVQSGNIRQA